MSFTVTWTSADGSTLRLDDETVDGYLIEDGTFGLDVPPITNYTHAYVGAAGSALNKRRYPERIVDMAIYIEDDTRVWSKVATLASALKGPGSLEIDDGTNIRTLLNVIYNGGLEGDWELRRFFMPDTGTQYRRFVVSLLALDPWWYGQPRTLTLNYGEEIAFDDSGTDFDESVGFDGSTANGIEVEGDEEPSPVTTIRGPFTTCQVGIAGGQTFELADALADGDTIYVDTRPGSRGPRRNDGGVDWSLLTPESRLWTLPIGQSVLNVQATGDGANSLVEVAYRQRWLTP